MTIQKYFFGESFLPNEKKLIPRKNSKSRELAFNEMSHKLKGLSPDVSNLSPSQNVFYSLFRRLKLNSKRVLILHTHPSYSHFELDRKLFIRE